jgi:hypothetical protein
MCACCRFVTIPSGYQSFSGTLDNKPIGPSWTLDGSRGFRAGVERWLSALELCGSRILILGSCNAFNCFRQEAVSCHLISDSVLNNAFLVVSFRSSALYFQSLLANHLASLSECFCSVYATMFAHKFMPLPHRFLLFSSQEHIHYYLLP